MTLPTSVRWHLDADFRVSHGGFSGRIAPSIRRPDEIQLHIALWSWMWSWIYWKIQLYLRYYRISFRLYSVIARGRKSSFTRCCEVGCEVGFQKKGSINIYNNYIILYILNYKITTNPTSQKIALSSIMCIYVILWSWISSFLLLALYTLFIGLFGFMSLFPMNPTSQVSPCS